MNTRLMFLFSLLLLGALVLGACGDEVVPASTSEEPAAEEPTEEPEEPAEEPTEEPVQEPTEPEVLSVPLEGDDLAMFEARVLDAGLVEDIEMIVAGSPAGVPFDDGYDTQGAMTTIGGEIFVTTPSYERIPQIGVLLIDVQLDIEGEMHHPVGNYQVANAGSEDEPKIVLYDPQQDLEIVMDRPGLIPETDEFIVTTASHRRCGWWIFCGNC